MYILALAGIFLAASAASATMVNDGSLLLRGKIVEGGCNMKTVSHTLTIACPRDGVEDNQRIDFKTRTTQVQGASQLANVQVRYLNTPYSKVLVGVSYN